MRGQAPPRDDHGSLHLQVETDPAASSQDGASKRSTRLLWAGLGFAVLMLSGVAACVLLPLASQASAKPLHHFSEVAFAPLALAPHRIAIAPTGRLPSAMASHRRPVVVPSLRPGRGAWLQMQSRPGSRRHMQDARRDDNDPTVFASSSLQDVGSLLEDGRAAGGAEAISEEVRSALMQKAKLVYATSAKTRSSRVNLKAAVDEQTTKISVESDILALDDEKANLEQEKAAATVAANQMQADTSDRPRKRQAFAGMATTDRVQRLKNILTDRLIRNVLASCEFALRLEVSGESLAKIDFPNLLKRIDNSVDILQLRSNGQTGDEDMLMERLQSASAELSMCMEQECDIDAAQAALQEAALDRVLQSNEPAAVTAAALQEAASSADITGVDNIKIKDLAEQTAPSLKFVVRKDGTVDYEALASSSREVANFGSDLWDRLNGKDNEESLQMPDIKTFFSPKAENKEEFTAEVQRLQEVKDRAYAALNRMLALGVETRLQIRQTKSLDRSLSNNDVVSLLAIDKKAAELRKLVKLCEFNLDIEQICEYLEKDIKESVVESVDTKLSVAEVTLIERQYMGIMGGLGTSDLEEIIDDQADDDDVAASPFLVLVNDDELGLLRTKIEELKTRLVIAGSLSAPIDYGTIGEVWDKFKTKSRAGLDFYGGGTQMLGSDVMETGKLFLKALGGKTLLPREVNSIRRNAKDLATLVPFLIILIAPLTPVGHVLVFGFIQRYFPEFFPSFFNEKRQNLRQLYSDVLTFDEEALLGPPPKQPSRLSLLWKKITFQEEKSDEEKDKTSVVDELWAESSQSSRKDIDKKNAVGGAAAAATATAAAAAAASEAGLL